MTECLAPACVVQPTVQFLVGGGVVVVVVVVMVPTPYTRLYTLDRAQAHTGYVLTWRNLLLRRKLSALTARSLYQFVF